MKRLVRLASRPRKERFDVKESGALVTRDWCHVVHLAAGHTIFHCGLWPLVSGRLEVHLPSGHFLRTKWYNSPMVKILTLPNPILRQKSVAVKIDQATADLVAKLKETLIEKEGIKGVGLSAVQIGIPKKVFLAYSKPSRMFLTFINPEIIWYSKKQTQGIPENKNKYEGCLSVPNYWSIIKRSLSIKIRYQTLSGKKQIRRFLGFTATIIQHEYDHLEGVLFIDRAIEQKSPIYMLTKDKDGKEYLKEITI